MRIQDRLYAAKIFLLFYLSSSCCCTRTFAFSDNPQKTPFPSIHFIIRYLPFCYLLCTVSRNLPATLEPLDRQKKLILRPSIYRFLVSTFAPHTTAHQCKAQRKPPDPHTSHDTRVFCVMTYFSLKVTSVCERVSRHENARAQPTKKRYRVATLV